MIVKLSKKEIAFCEQAAALRWQLARVSGVKNQRRDKGRSDNDLDLLGIKAETAVAKVLNVEHNPFQIGIDSGSDIWLDEISIDVKSTFYENGKLLFKNKEAFRAFCSVLVCEIDTSTMKIAGFISKEKFMSLCYSIDLGHGVGVAVNQSELACISKLWLHNTKQKLKGEPNDYKN